MTCRCRHNPGVDSLTPEEIRTLATYAARRGHTWKTRLIASWRGGVPAAMHSIAAKLGEAGVKSLSTQQLEDASFRAFGDSSPLIPGAGGPMHMSMQRWNPSSGRYGYALTDGTSTVRYSNSLTEAESRAAALSTKHGRPAQVWDTQMNAVVSHVRGGSVRFTAAHPQPRRNPRTPITATKTRTGAMRVCQTTSRRESDRMTKLFMRAVRSKPGTTVRGNPTSKMNIALPPEVVTALFEWHGGQSTPTYSLASTGLHHTVSLDMIRAAKEELGRVLSRTPRSKERSHLLRLLDTLHTIQQYPEEYTYE